ncbi:MAG: hypothetical protein WCI55_11820 [Armatimonadota bacterium]
MTNKALFSLVLLSSVAVSNATPVAHRYSYHGLKPYVNGGSSSGPFRDNDNKPFYCDSWRIHNDQILLIGYRYINEADWWRDQKYVLAIDVSGMENNEPFGVNAGSVIEIGGRTYGMWGPITKDFTNSGDGQTLSNWDHGYNADPAVYGVGSYTKMPPYNGDGPGVWRIGLRAVRSNFTTRDDRTEVCFWPEKNAVGAGNVFKTGSKPNDPGGSGADPGGGGTGDPNGNNDGWGSILSLDWWKKLMVFLFVPSQTDVEVIKASFMQFQNWGPFKLIADISSVLGNIAGGSMGDLTADYKIPLGQWGAMWGSSYVPVLDLSPWASWVQLFRVLMLGFFMIKTGGFWWQKYAQVLSKS